MRNSAILVLSLIVGFALWQKWTGGQKPDSSEAELITPHPSAHLFPKEKLARPQDKVKVEAKTEAKLEPKIKVKETPSPLVTARPTLPEAERHKPPEGSVPYTYKNGWVIAYGDILLGKPKNPDFAASGFIESPRLNLWPQAIVPFSIDDSLPNPERVMKVIAYMNTYTPVRFVPFTGQPDSVVFFPMRDLCVSYLGKIGGHQPIYLDDRCSDHEITHELMHALGFIHEHSRADRDQYVQVLWKNIEEDKLDQFDVTPLTLNEPLKGRPFDFNSVMLYSNTAFARQPGTNTLLSRSSTQPISPTSQGLSPEDMERLRIVYAR